MEIDALGNIYYYYYHHHLSRLVSEAGTPLVTHIGQLRLEQVATGHGGRVAP